MIYSTDRILTTHAGSLPRPEDVREMVFAKARGESYDQVALDRRLEAAVKEAVKQQIACGLDIVNEGELSKPNFTDYVLQRIAGCEKRPGTGRRRLDMTARDERKFAGYFASHPRSGFSGGQVLPVCVGELHYVGQSELQKDLENFKAALAGATVAGAFLPANTPGTIEHWMANEHYRSDEAFLFAIAEAMREEYRAIVENGFLLQIDDPFLVTYYIMRPHLSIADCRKWAELRVAALNAATEGIPPERIRFHTCYSINMGPRVHDMALADMIDIILKVRAGAYSFEAANPRHEHEWEEWGRVKLPDDKALIPGVITQSTVLVEHPELVAQRISRFADIVGRERVLAGADCGFASFAGSNEVHPSIVWAKLAALVEGARIASRRLWPRA